MGDKVKGDQEPSERKWVPMSGVKPLTPEESAKICEALNEYTRNGGKGYPSIWDKE